MDPTSKLSNLINSFNKKKKFNNRNNTVITQKDIKNLSRFEQHTLRLFAKMYDLVLGKEDVLDFKKVSELFETWGRHKTDPEKTYLKALFFPEKITKVHQVNPFPTPSYTFKQTLTYRFTPNNNGNFVIQIVNPFFPDDTTLNTVSNIYVCTDNALDGSGQGAGNITAASAVLGTNWFAWPGAKFGTGWFNAASLVAFKVSVRYIGIFIFKTLSAQRRYR